jgi:hypothetical protein
MNQLLLAKTSEINRNLAQFLLALPTLVPEHEGKYALLRHGQVIEFYRTAVDAQIAGNQRYDDNMFSIQLVKNSPEELGYFSSALHTR